MNNILSIIKLADSQVTSLIFLILGGLGTFLYGLDLMSSSLKSMAGSKLKIIISKATDNVFKGFLTGLLITIAIQSSSATTVIAIGLISAGLLDLKHALPIMIGAHIGTTVTAFIIGLNIGSIAFPLIFLGAFIILLIKRRKWSLSGRIIIGTGFLFLGLELMSTSFGSFVSHDWFKNLMTSLSDNWILGFLSGVGLTCLIQSSSAFIGIVQELYIAEGSVMELNVVLTLVIGSNIGTTITALIASLGGNKTSKQAAFANSLVSIFGAILFLPLLKPLTNLFEIIQGSIFGSKNMFTVAMFHTFYNVIVCGICLFLSGLIVKLIELVIKTDKEKDYISAEHLNKELLKSPSLALSGAFESINDMNVLVLEMYDLSVSYFNENKEEFNNKITLLEDKVDLYEHLIHDYLMQLSEIHLNTDDAFLQTKYIDIIRDMERIGDHAMNFSDFMNNYYSKKVLMPSNMHDDLNHFFSVVRNQIYDTIEAFKNNDLLLANNVLRRENKIDEMEEDYRLKVHSYISHGEVNSLDILFIDIVSNLERISDHCTNISEMIIDPHMMSTFNKTIENK